MKLKVTCENSIDFLLAQYGLYVAEYNVPPQLNLTNTKKKRGLQVL